MSLPTILRSASVATWRDSCRIVLPPSSTRHAAILASPGRNGGGVIEDDHLAGLLRPEADLSVGSELEHWRSALRSHQAVRGLGALLPWCCGDQPLLRRRLAGLTRASDW